ncbi:hypothetical protein ATI61_103762 [Archangium gephyra]|uniref:Bacterial Ig-like domain protein n=1 Tax=Archangium gephyra TaxID=48 RepID=A0AAC8Q6Q5_9BACT|nr:hypothetical protein [Archangium gephyra]AKJ02045.1 Putative Bacterial Ig-like domain protein [Archangium gephyra]REG34848.1 hypothetical protein ATI61_103762 [Archangium gephyra]
MKMQSICGLALAALVLFGCPGEQTQPEEEASLAFTTQPSNTPAGSPLTVSVTVRDAQGNALSDSSAAVTLGLAANPAGGELLGTTTVNATQGVATFSLHIDKVGTGYALSASASGLNGATSETFEILPPQVAGTRTLHYVTDTGEVARPSDLSSAQVGAYVAEEDGGFTYYAGTGTDAGTFSIPGVPLQSYYLRFGNDYVLTSERDPDLSTYQQGRPDVQRGDAGTLVHTTLTGMSPWQNDHSGNSDDLQMYSSNAGAWFIQLHLYDTNGFSSPAIPDPGDTTFDQLTDYGRIAGSGFPPKLVDAAKGDTAVFTQLSTHDAGVVDDAGVSMGFTYQSVARVFTTSSLTVRDGQTSNVSGVLSSVPQDQSYAVDWKVDEGTPGSFGSYRTAVNPHALLNYNNFYLDVIPTAAYGSYASTPDLVSYVGGQPDHSFQFVYGNPFPASYAKFLVAETLFSVPYTFSKPEGGTAQTTVNGRIVTRELVSGPRVEPLVPGVSPVREPQLDGASAWLDQSIHPTPLVSWTPPAVGTPTHYEVRFTELVYNPATGRLSRGSGVGRVLTGGTRVQVPPGLLRSGKHYFMSITAHQQPGHSVQSAPYLLQWPHYYAEALSGLLTVP